MGCAFFPLIYHDRLQMVRCCSVSLPRVILWLKTLSATRLTSVRVPGSGLLKVVIGRNMWGNTVHSHNNATCFLCFGVVWNCLFSHLLQGYFTGTRKSYDANIEDIGKTLQWRHNDYDSVSNHQLYGCLLNRLFRPRSKKTSKLRVTGLCVGNSPGPVNSPHKGPVTRKMFPFDEVIMI